MSFFAQKIFLTLFLSDNFSLEHVEQAGFILIAYLAGLIFYSINKVLLNVFYALHDTVTPTVVSVVAVLVNVILNWVLMGYFKAAGLALATSISAASQTVLFLYLLKSRNRFKIYGFRFSLFAVRYMVHLAIVAVLFLSTYYVSAYYIAQLPAIYANFLLNKIGFWFWAGPVSLSALGLLWIMRKKFKEALHFLD
jgi:putative peptidoglycan lipid II flippase